MFVTVKVSDLLSKIKEIDKRKMDFVTLFVSEEQEMDDGGVIPETLVFSATANNDFMSIDFEGIETIAKSEDGRFFMGSSNLL